MSIFIVNPSIASVQGQPCPQRQRSLTLAVKVTKSGQNNSDFTVFLNRRITIFRKLIYNLLRDWLGTVATNGTFTLLPQRKNFVKLLGENFMAIFTTLSMVTSFSTGTLGIFATFFYVFTMRVVIYDILGMAIIPTLSTSILFCDLWYILLWISPRSMVEITIRI